MFCAVSGPGSHSPLYRNCCFLQEAVEENEQRKKQEEAMREKLLAQEAKQHDPKVKSKTQRKITEISFFFPLSVYHTRNVTNHELTVV